MSEQFSRTCQLLLPAEVTKDIYPWLRTHPRSIVTPDPHNSVGVAPASPGWGELCLSKVSPPSVKTSLLPVERVPAPWIGSDILCTSWPFSYRPEDQIGSQPCWHLDLGFSVPRMKRKHISIVEATQSMIFYDSSLGRLRQLAWTLWYR